MINTNARLSSKSGSDWKLHHCYGCLILFFLLLHFGTEPYNVAHSGFKCVLPLPLPPESWNRRLCHHTEQPSLVHVSWMQKMQQWMLSPSETKMIRITQEENECLYSMRHLPISFYFCLLAFVLLCFKIWFFMCSVSTWMHIWEQKRASDPLDSELAATVNLGMGA